MSGVLLIGAGIVIASAVGPAREWRSAFYVRQQGETETVDRSEVVRTEGGVPGSVVFVPRQEVIRERVQLAEQLIKRPIPKSAVKPLPPSPIVRRDVPLRRPDTGVTIGAKVAWMAIPTSNSNGPGATALPGSQPQIVHSGPTQSAAPMRTTTTSKSTGDGWNRVVVTSGIDGRKTDLEVHDSQLHLFEPAEQTQTRMTAALRNIANGDASSMQSLYRDIVSAEAAATKTRVYQGAQRRPWSSRPITGISANPGAIDPRLVQDDNENAAAIELSKLNGVERYKELLSRGKSDEAADYLTLYLSGNKDDGRGHAVLGLQQLDDKKFELGLKSLARACELGASAFSEPIDLAAFGISQAGVAESLGRLMAQKEQAKGMQQAMGMASAAQAIGRLEAAKKLLDQAVVLGMDPAESAYLAGLWKIRK